MFGTPLLFLLAIAQTPDLVDTTIDPAGNIRRFTVAPGVNVAPADFAASYGWVWELGPSDTVTEVAWRPGPGDTTIHLFLQSYQGVPVSGGALTLVARDGRVVHGLSRLVGGHSGSAIATINDAHARNTALDAISAHVGVNRVHLEYGMPTARLIVDLQRQLAWQITYSVNRPVSARYVVDVDATTGAVRRMRPVDQRAWDPAVINGIDIFDETRQVNAERETGSTRVRLRHAPSGIETYDAQSSLPPYNDTDFEEFGGAFTAASARGVFAHYGVQRSREFFTAAFGLNGFDGNGGGVQIYVDALLQGPEQLTTAAYDRTLRRILIPPGGDNFTFDIMAHEAAHVVQSELILGFPDGGFDPAAEAAGLSEGFADVFAVAVDRYVDASAFNWDFGEDLGVPLRHINNPTAAGATETGVDDYQTPDFENYPPHAQGGVVGRWFYLTAIGGSGDYHGTPWLTEGIGFEQAQEIAFHSMIRLSPWATFPGARDATILTTRDICGRATAMERTVTEAWFAVGVGPQYQSEEFFPPDGTLGVRPWPTVFRWQAFPEETRWVLEVDTSPSFDSVDDNRIFLVGETTELDGVSLAFHPVNLRPDTTYHWRVRANVPGSNVLSSCWRPARSFTTDPHLPTVRGPDETDSDVHPWGMALRWSQSAGATVYLMEGEDSTFGPLYSRPIAATDELCGLQNQCQRIVDAVADSQFRWRVKAFGPTDTYHPNETAFSESGFFTTSEPSTEITAPVAGEEVYPWRIPVFWAETPGASQYYLDAGAASSTGGVVVSAPETAGPISVTPMFDEENSPIFLSVTPHRLIEPDVGSPFLDEGATSAVVQVINEGSETIPCVASPWDFCGLFDESFSDLPPRLAYGAPVTFVWSDVLHAIGYRVSLYRFHDAPDPLFFGVDFGDLLYTEDFMSPDGSSANAPQLAEVLGEVATSPAHASSTYGIWYTVQAIGPDGSASPISHIGPRPILGPYAGQLGDNLFLIDPPPVEPDDTQWSLAPSGRVYREPGNLVGVFARQTPVYAPEGTYDFFFYRNGGCEGIPEILENEDLSAQVNNPTDGQTYSFQARVHTDYAPTFPLSECLSWTMADSSDYCGNGQPDDNEECDDGNQNDDDGCDNTCRARFPCNQEFGDQGGPEGGVFEVAMATSELLEGQAYLLLNTFDIPDRLTVRYENQIIAETSPQCIGSQGVMAIPLGAFSGSQTSVFVEVEANCDPDHQGETRWAFRVTCPEGSGGDPGGTPEP